MLCALRLRPGMRVLDVGAGSGYAAALLARLVTPGGRVTAVERLGMLVRTTRPLLASLAIEVELIQADGLAGVPSQAPFDAIHVACACPEPPPALVAQLALNGRMILPVGPRDGDQELRCLERRSTGLATTAGWSVSFVPALPGLD
jgi:protein-L-isoaspartate(D-aspartate) O-methyltransferase